MPPGRPTWAPLQLARLRTRLGSRGGAAAAAAAARARGSFGPIHGKAVEPQAAEHQGPRPRPTRPSRPAADAPAQGATTADAAPAAVPRRSSQGRRDAAGAAAADASRPPPGKAGEEQARRAGGAPGAARALEMTVLAQPPERVVAQQQHPHMAPPPYLHHFDSYSLVKQLQRGGYTPEQATTAMKGIRALLAQNLAVAQRSLVSKSDVENETYLFTAACSELSTEIKNNRRLQDEQTRQQRTLLQHEVDILAQSLNQELLTLNDNVRGMFNDRKMAVREEHKAGESAIQKITYKMSILLSSDCKSEIEAVRWILIRQSVLGIIFMAMLTLGMLRYATYVGQQRKLEAERHQREQEELRKNGGKADHSSAADAAAILAAN